MEKKEQKKSKSQYSPKKSEAAEEDSEKIAGWDVKKLNKALEDKIKELIPAIKQQLSKQAHQEK